jgi:hypothetical protein
MYGNQGGNRGTPPQNPGNQNHMIPKERFDQVLSQVETLKQQNSEMRGMIQSLFQQQQAQRQPQQPPPPEETPFEPNTQKAIKSLFQQELRQQINPLVQDFRQQIGHLSDENDKLLFINTYGLESYDKYKPKIESLRREQSQQGRYITREEAYKLVHFDETQRKPKTQPTQPLGPAFDPYTGDIVNPQQTQVNPGQQPGQPPQQQQAQFQQPQQAPPYNPQVAQHYQVPGFQPQPQSNEFGENYDPGLPPAGITEGGFVPPQNAGQVGPLNIGMSDKELDAWAEKYGDKNF